MKAYKARVEFTALFDARDDDHAEEIMNDFISKIGNVETSVEELGFLAWPDVDWEIEEDEDGEVMSK